MRDRGSTDTWTFGRCVVQPGQRQLLIDGQPARLGSRAFDLLVTLIERRDRNVGKRELLDLVWSGVIVEESNLPVQVSGLRQLIGAQAITTVPGRGYRFTAPLAQERAGRPALAEAEPPPPAAGLGGNLPRLPPRLIGRDADLDEVCGRLHQRRLLTLTGAAGIGKTSLALAAAHRLAREDSLPAWLVGLAPVADAAALPAAVAQALRVTLPGRAAAIDELLDRLRGAPLLLVLDNCEHLVAGVAAMVQRLLDAAPLLRVLCTSQQRLNLPDEQLWRLAALSVPDSDELDDAARHSAVALFVERVQAQQPAFTLGEHNVAAVVDICRQLDGMALALEFAAARVPSLGVRRVQQLLAERFRLLTQHQRHAPPRHQTLRATLDWCHALLSPAEQAVFRRLAVFAGSFGIELAEAVLVDAGIDRWEMLDHLGALIDKSMLVAAGESSPRYHLLETARAYALEQLDAAGERATTQRRLADGLLALIDRHMGAALRDRESMDQVCDACVPEIDNLRAAIAWALGPEGDAALALRLVNCTPVLMYQIGRYPECLGWMLQVEPLVGEHTPALDRARFCYGQAVVGLHGGLTAQKRHDLLRQALAIFVVHADTVMADRTRLALVYVDLVRNDIGAAEAWLQQVDISDSASSPRHHLRATWYYVQGIVLRHSGRLAAALDAFGQALERARAAGSSRLSFDVLNQLGAVHLEMGHVDEAVAQHRALLAPGRGALRMDHQMRAFAMAWLAHDLTVQGRLAEARTLLLEALPTMRRTVGVRHFSGMLALLAARQGRLHHAALLVGADDAARQRRGEARLHADEQRLATTLAIIEAVHPADQVARWRSDGARLDEEATVQLAAGDAATLSNSPPTAPD